MTQTNLRRRWSHEVDGRNHSLMENFVRICQGAWDHFCKRVSNNRGSDWNLAGSQSANLHGHFVPFEALALLCVFYTGVAFLRNISSVSQSRHLIVKGVPFNWGQVDIRAFVIEGPLLLVKSLRFRTPWTVGRRHNQAHDHTFGSLWEAGEAEVGHRFLASEYWNFQHTTSLQYVHQ